MYFAIVRSLPSRGSCILRRLYCFIRLFVEKNYLLKRRGKEGEGEEKNDRSQ